MAPSAASSQVSADCGGDLLARPHPQVDGRPEQVPLRAEVVRHERRIDSGRASHCPDRRALVALGEERLAGGGQDGLACGGRLGAGGVRPASGPTTACATEKGGFGLLLGYRRRRRSAGGIAGHSWRLRVLPSPPAAGPTENGEVPGNAALGRGRRHRGYVTSTVFLEKSIDTIFNSVQSVGVSPGCSWRSFGVMTPRGVRTDGGGGRVFQHR